MFELFWIFDMRFHTLLLIIIFKLYYYININVQRFLLAYKAHLLYFSFSSWSCRMLMIGYGLDLQMNGLIDRTSLMSDQMVEEIKFLII